MPRQAKLRIKGRKKGAPSSGRWYTDAGGHGVYFGRVNQVDRADAQRMFLDHLAKAASTKPAAGIVSAAVLFDQFLDAVQQHRVGRTYAERKLHLHRFAHYRRGVKPIGDLAARGIEAADLVGFLEFAKGKFDLDEFTAHKHATSIVAAFNWGAGLARLKNPKPCLPVTFRPFAHVERYRAPAHELHEDELPTPDEIEALLEYADTDIAQIYEKGRWRSRRPDERRTGKDNPYVGFGDILRVYLHTGARTSELASCDVRDCIHGTRHIVLGRHKRSKTMRDATARRITLNDEAYAIVKRWCSGKGPSDPIFTDPPRPGRPSRRWTRHTLDMRFKQVRVLAEVRDCITIYSFRHLWISEALMSGVDIATCAKMAGTSVAMVERVYGHFSGSHMADAQGRLDAFRRRSGP